MLFLVMLQNSQESTCARVSFLIKLHEYNFIKKETLSQVFSCEFYEISKNTLNTFSHRTSPVPVSVNCKLNGNFIFIKLMIYIIILS